MQNLPELQAEIRRSLDAGDHDGALARLEPQGPNHYNELLECAAITERAGDERAAAGDTDRAVRFWHLALTGWEVEASMATGGGEGMQRMIAVNRVREKIERAKSPG